MENKFKVLEILYQKENSFVSGEELSKRLDVTRTSVANYVKELKNYGYAIDAKTNSGYKFQKSLNNFDIYNYYEIKKLIPDFEIVYEEEVTSTNTLAKDFIRKNKNKKYIVTTKNQVQGKGRYDRSFFSTSENGLYFSIALKPDKVISDIPIIPITAALSVSHGLKEVCNIETKIKWPNDVLFENRKICGILTEASVEAESNKINYGVIGIGININHTENDFPNELKSIATSLYMINAKKYRRVDILGAVVKKFSEFITYDNYKIIELYKEAIILNRDISFYKNGCKVVGRIENVKENGNLLVSVDGETMTVESGEINFI